MASKQKFECVVCMEERSDRVVLECKHVICFQCAKKWQARGKNTCPCCRYDSAVLTGLKSRCPPLKPNGVSRVAVKRRKPGRANRSVPPNITAVFYRCMGCARTVPESQCTRDARCGQHTCQLCSVVLSALNDDTRGCVACMCAEMGLTDAMLDTGELPTGALEFLGVGRDEVIVLTDSDVEVSN